MTCDYCDNPAFVIIDESLSSVLNDTKSGTLCRECYQQVTPKLYTEVL